MGRGDYSMIDREKTISLLVEIKEYFRECRQNASLGSNAETRFWVLQNAASEAAELLKGQEPVEAKVMGESESHGSWWFACGACGHAIDPEDNFCRECGKKAKWDG